MKRLVIFGSIPLTKKCIEYILENYSNEVELLGVACIKLNNTWRNTEDSVYEYAKRNKIKILTHEEIEKLVPDIGLSIRYNKLLKKGLLDSFKIGVFNTHGGILPNYRGTYCNIHPIINNEKYFGVTLHKVDEGIDTGDIIDIKKIEIQNNDTGYDLYLKGEKLCFELIKDNFKKIIQNDFKKIKQETLAKNRNLKINTYKTKDIEKLKKIEKEEIEKKYNTIRAFDSPYHEPAYTYIDGKKIYLRIKY